MNHKNCIPKLTVIRIKGLVWLKRKREKTNYESRRILLVNEMIPKYTTELALL